MSVVSVTTITPPASSSLISLSQVKLYLSVTDTANDTLYTQLITDASSSMIDFIGVHPGRQRYLESTYGTGSVRRYLSRLPVEPGTLSITLDGEALTEGTTDPTQWSLEEASTGMVYRESGWPYSSSYTLNLTYTYYAGFLLPDQIADWQGSTVKGVGAWVRPLPSSTPSLYRFECTTPGTTGTSQPVWPTTIGGTVIDGTVVWTARAAPELPPVVSQWCFAEFLRLLNARNSTPGLASRTVEGVSESYFATQTTGPLAPTVMNGLSGFRKRLGVLGVA